MVFDLSNYQLSAGSSKSFRLRTNSAGATDVAGSGVSMTLSVTVNAAGDVTWKDALDAAAATGLNLESYVTPIQIQSVSYAQGT